jgi:HD-GYP domain-containing protein (c-di-GMP phosphodiesterase class II)
MPGEMSRVKHLQDKLSASLTQSRARTKDNSLIKISRSIEANVKRVDLTSLITGQMSEHEYFSDNGDLLIARGIILTERHLEMLKRRNILDLYIEGTDEEHIVHEILSTDYSRHQMALPSDLDRELNFSPQIQSFAGGQSCQKPHALELPEFKGILNGEHGFKQLSESKKAAALDDRLSEGRCVDQPVGLALKGKLRQIGTKERSDEYKKLTANVYNDLIVRTKSILDSLADAKRLDYSAVRSIIEQLLRILTNDMCYLLNIVALHHTEEEHIYNHSLNVSIYTLGIATLSGYNQHQVIEIGIGALLHDIGMLLVPREIYLKKGKLDRDEWYEIMKHPVLGVHLLEKMDRLPEWIPFMAYQCHERENGKGYPKQRSSRFIHNYAKICAVADMYEAFSSSRPYRDAYIPYKALELVIKASRQGLISGEFTKALVQVLSLFPVGSIVELSNRYIGKVIKSNAASPSKPTVCLMFDENGKALSSGGSFEVDLSTNLSLSIIKAHPNDYKDIFWMSGF